MADKTVHTSGPAPLFTLQVFFTSEDGIARADLHLTSPGDPTGRLVEIRASGALYDAREHDSPLNGRSQDYRSATSAMEAGLRALGRTLTQSWEGYAAKNGPGAR